MGEGIGAKSRLRLDKVLFSREGKTILRDISLDMSFHRLGIVGRNGSGKSTLVRLVAGLVKASGGGVLLNGIDMARDRRAALSEVGVLFQDPDHQLIFPMVVEEISFGLTQMGQSKDQALDGARATLSTFGVPHWENAYVNTLSQGQKHLLCLMSVAAMVPRVMVLDEPLAGMDIPTRAQLTRYLTHYAGDLIHITHDPDDLAGYDHVVWLDQGQVAGFGPATPVLARYAARMAALGEADDIADLSG